MSSQQSSKDQHSLHDRHSLRERLCHSLVEEWLAQLEFELLDVKSARVLADHPWASGKRLRPMTFLLSYLCVRTAQGHATELSHREVQLGAAIELMHEASLVHDDLVDRSTIRRGSPTVQMSNGSSRALLIGDYMVFRALKLALDSASTQRDIALAQELADTGLSIAHGELQQLEAFLQSVDPEARMSIDSYLDVIGKKTAMFFAGCAEGGAALAGANHAMRKEFHDFGYKMGIAFQMLDDMIDVFGDAQRAQKSLSHNLNELTVTLPFILAYRKFPEDPGLQALAWAKPLTPDQMDRTLQLSRDASLKSECDALVEEQFKLAVAAQERLPKNAFSLGLGDLLDYVLSCGWGGLHSPLQSGPRSGHHDGSPHDKPPTDEPSKADHEPPEGDRDRREPSSTESPSDSNEASSGESSAS